MSAADDYLTELADRLLARGVDNQQVNNLLAERARDPDAWCP